MGHKNNQEKLIKLKSLYELYDSYVGTIKTACIKGCAACCTCNVIMTSLETEYLFASLTNEAKEKMIAKIKINCCKKRYHPKVTFNGFAAMCIKGEDIFMEDNDPLWGKCPLLQDDICPVYKGRPFGCRCLVSQKNCYKEGFAQIPPLVLTINTIFMQYIETLDAHGFSGNLTDMILFSLCDKGLKENNTILKNTKADSIMIPPEHRENTKLLLKKITDILR